MEETLHYRPDEQIASHELLKLPPVVCFIIPYFLRVLFLSNRFSWQDWLRYTLIGHFPTRGFFM